MVEAGTSIARRARAIAVIAVAVATVVPATLSGAAPPVAPAASLVAAPPNAAPDPHSALLGVSCTGANGCVAVGSYASTTGAVLAQVAQLVAGLPYHAVQVPLPAGAAAQPDATLRAVSCPVPQDCVAVGSYTTTAGRTVALASQIESGSPSPLPAPPVPAGAATDPRVMPAAVACATPTACLVAGTFSTKAGATTPFALRLAAGSWLAPVALPLPAGHKANPSAVVAGTSCWVPGGCAIVGTYASSDGTTQAFVVRTSKWAATSVAKLPAGNPGVASVGGVSCPSAGACLVAVTLRLSATSTTPFALREAGTSWLLSHVKVPADGAAAQSATVGAPSCSAPGACLAIGSYRTKGGARLGFSDVLIGSSWHTATAVGAPAGTASTKVQLLAGSCTPRRACTFAGRATATAGALVAVGGAAYLSPSPPSGLTAHQGTGRTVELSWSPAVIAAAGIAGYLVWRAAGAATPTLLGVAPSTGFTDRTGLTYGVRYTYLVATYGADRQTSARLAVSLVAYAPASAPRAVRATAGVGSVTATWSPPSSDGGSAIVQYEVKVSVAGSSQRVLVPGTARSAKVPGLASHATVTIQVAAVTSAGLGAFSAPVKVVTS